MPSVLTPRTEATRTRARSAGRPARARRDSWLQHRRSSDTAGPASAAPIRGSTRPAAWSCGVASRPGEDASFAAVRRRARGVGQPGRGPGAPNPETWMGSATQPLVYQAGCGAAQRQQPTGGVRPSATASAGASPGRGARRWRRTSVIGAPCRSGTSVGGAQPVRVLRSHPCDRGAGTTTHGGTAWRVRGVYGTSATAARGHAPVRLGRRGPRKGCACWAQPFASHRLKPSATWPPVPPR
jgi:hypothetical protein